MEIDINPFIMIFSIASIVAILAKQVRLPYTISLVIAGIIVSIIGLESPFVLDQKLIFHILLPPLLFEAGLHMKLSHLRKNAKVITMLVLPGLIASLLVVSFFINWLFPAIPFMIVLLFVAIIIPTDPISILALFREMKVPSRVSIIVEGESIFNDGVAIVIFKVILGLIVASGASVVVSSGDIGNGIIEFLRLTTFGILLGGGAGWLTYMIIQKIDDSFTEVMITVILAFGLFATAEAMGASGVFAVVVAALVLGNYGTRFAMAPSTRMTLLTFWAFLAFAVNSFLFLLIGFEVHFTGSSMEFGLIVIGIVMLFFSRAVMVFLIGKFVNRDKTELPKRWQMIIWWGGIRGAIPIALALSIPLVLDVVDHAGNPVLFPYHDLLLAATFGVVLFSLLIQGLTLKPLLRSLGFQAPSKKEKDKEDREIAALIKDTVDELAHLRDDGEISTKAHEWLTHKFAMSNSQLLTELGLLVDEQGIIPREEYKLSVKETLVEKKKAVQEAWENKLISGAVGERLILEIDSQIQILSKDDDNITQPTMSTEFFKNVATPQTRNRHHSIERNCGICLQPIKADEPVTKCRCGTIFHDTCIVGVSRCPICIAVLENGQHGVGDF